MSAIAQPAFDVRLDPAVLCTDPITGELTRTELKLNDGPIRIDQAGIDWGDAQIQAYMADQRVGSTAIDYRIPNRIVKIPLFVGADESEQFDVQKLYLMTKVARLQAEGGWMQRKPGLYADVVNATLTFPDVWGEVAGLEPNVVLQLECLPDFYGDEITLDPVTTTPLPGLGLAKLLPSALWNTLQLNGKQAFIKGDVPGRVRLQVANAYPQAIKSLLWGLRGRYSDSTDATSSLLYKACDLNPVNNTSVVGTAHTTGAYLQNTTLSTTTWMAVMTFLLTISGAGGGPINQPMTHRGTYHVWARVQSPSVPFLRLSWGVGSLSAAVYNPQVQLPSNPNQWLLVDLGEVRLDAPPIGPMQWFGAIQALADASGAVIDIDDVLLQPVDDGAGRLIYNPNTPPGIVSQGPAPPHTMADSATIGTIAWTNPANIAAKDGSCATATWTASGQQSHYLSATNMTFNIPAGAIIQGVQVTVYRYESVVGSTFDASVKLAAGPSGTQDKAYTLASWGTNTGNSWTYGGPTDLWGAAGSAWTPAIINAAAFGVLFSAKSNAASGVANVDQIVMTVWYGTATGMSVQTDAVIYPASSTANQINCEVRTEGMYRNDPTGQVYGEVSRVIGDLPRIPVSGMEGRAIEVWARSSPGDLAALADGPQQNASGSLSQIQTYYRPCWLFPP